MGVGGGAWWRRVNSRMRWLEMDMWMGKAARRGHIEDEMAARCGRCRGWERSSNGCWRATEGTSETEICARCGAKALNFDAPGAFLKVGAPC